MDAECLSIILNAEVIAVNQDARVARGSLVYMWPAASWPNNTVSAAMREADAPLPLAGLGMAPCNASDPSQAFAFNASDATLRWLGGGGTGAQPASCLSYLGYHEANFHVTECTTPPWTAPGIGSQRWTLDGPALRVQDNPGKVADVLDCALSPAAGSVQVCTAGGADCYSSGSPPPGCGADGQAWRMDGSGAATTIASAVDSYSHCIAVVPLPAPPVDIRLQVWAKPLADGSVAAVLFNRSPAPLLANLTWAMLGFPPAARLALRDLWAHADLGPVAGGQWQAVVQPHDVVMVRASLAAA